MVYARGLHCIKAYKDNGKDWAVSTEVFYIWLFLM